jgi:hypothetical protein
MSREIKCLTRTPTYAAIMKRFDTNLTCPWMAPLPTPSICPFLIIFIVAEPRAVDVSSSHQFEEEIGAASSENGPFIAKMEFSVRTP